MNWFNLHKRAIASFLFVLALLRSFFLLSVAAPTYGADGAFYLHYMDSFIAGDTSLERTFGTTPIYPLFAYFFYQLGGGNAIVTAQILLGACAAAAVFLSLYPLHPTAAFLSGVLLAIDPQVGHILQLVATEGLYIPLLTIAIAAFFYEVHAGKRPYTAFGLGLIIGISCLTRPVGTYLIFPYIVCYALISRSFKRTIFVAVGYLAILLVVCFINLWRFDFFGVNSTNGFYLGARLFSQEDLYQPENGEASEKLAQLAFECGFQLEQNFQSYEAIRRCTDQRLSYQESSTLYQEAYFEAVQTSPQAYIRGFLNRFVQYNWRQSSAYLPNDVVSRPINCSVEGTGKYSLQAVFCPSPPTPLSSLREITFTGVLGFSIFTRSFIGFGLALLLIPATRLHSIFVFCLLGYAYHAAVTAVANDLLARYVTVTNPYTLITLAFGLVLLYETVTNWIATRQTTAKSPSVS